MERARGVLWSQMLHMRDPQLEHVLEELAVQLKGLVHSAATPGRSLRGGALTDHLTPPERHEDYAQRNQLQDLLRQICALPGLSDFMRGPDVETLLNIGTQNPVVVLIADEEECHALLITSGERALTHLLIPQVTRKTLHNLTFEGLTPQKRGAAANVGDTNRGMFIAKGASPAHARLAKLWHTVVKPILQQLGLPVRAVVQHFIAVVLMNLQKAQGRNRPRVHWCPTGRFAFVPVHAVGVYEGVHQECCADYVVSSYTPTLSALIEARKGASTFNRQQTKLMTVAAEQAHSSNMPRLRYAVSDTRDVVDIVTKAGGSRSFDATAAPISEVLTNLQSSQVIHLACHGIQHQSEPHRSRFCLSTGDLMVSELMHLDLKGVFLAYLSACETAKGDQKHADEAIHLAATMLFVGLDMFLPYDLYQTL